MDYGVSEQAKFCCVPWSWSACKFGEQLGKVTTYNYDRVNLNPNRNSWKWCTVGGARLVSIPRKNEAGGAGGSPYLLLQHRFPHSLPRDGLTNASSLLLPWFIGSLPPLPLTQLFHPRELSRLVVALVGRVCVDLCGVLCAWCCCHPSPPLPLPLCFGDSSNLSTTCDLNTGY